MNDSVLHSWKGDCSEEKDDQDHIGIDGSDINDSRALGNSLDDAQVHQDPSNQ